MTQQEFNEQVAADIRRLIQQGEARAATAEADDAATPDSTACSGCGREKHTGCHCGCQAHIAELEAAASQHAAIAERCAKLEGLARGMAGWMFRGSVTPHKFEDLYERARELGVRDE